MTKVLLNGEPAATIAIGDRGLLYGDGLFETVAIRDGGPRLFDYHLDRMHDGCARLGLPMPDRALLNDEILFLVGDRQTATLRITLTRGVGPRGYAPPPNVQASRILSLAEANAYPTDMYSQGVRVRTCTTPISINHAIAGLKTLNRLDQVLARAEWQDPHIAEGLMSNDRGQVICGTMSNVFFVEDNRLFTPQLSASGVAGVMRRLLIERSAEAGFRCSETVATQKRLLNADEVFLTNSQFGIWPVRRVDAQEFRVGPVTRAVMTTLALAGIAELRP